MHTVSNLSFNVHTVSINW